MSKTFKDKNGNLLGTFLESSDVAANPVLSGNETELIGIQVGNTKYKASSGSNIGGLYPNTILKGLATKFEAPEGLTDGTIAYITVQNLRELIEEKMDLSETYAFKNNEGSHDGYAIDVDLVTSYWDYSSSPNTYPVWSHINFSVDSDSEGNVYLTISVTDLDATELVHEEYSIGTTSNNITWEDAFDTLDPTERIVLAKMDSTDYYSFCGSDYTLFTICNSPFFTALNCRDTNDLSKAYTLDLEKFIDFIERADEE